MPCSALGFHSSLISPWSLPSLLTRNLDTWEQSFLVGHHLSVVMALSPSPSNLHLHLLLQPQAHYSNTFRTLKFNCSCSYHSIQVDTQQVKVPLKTTKAKRKPRPSFFEQIRDKWSLKINSPREKFPWQEQAEETQNSSGVVVPDSEVIDSSVGSPVSSASESRFVSVPCIHESKPRNPRLVSEPEISQNSCEQGVNVKTEIEMGDANVSLNEKPPGGDEDFGNFEGFSGNSSLIELPWKRREGLQPVERDGWGRRNTRMAERMVPEHELRRLKNIALRMLERIKVGAAGVTQSLVDAIHEKWRKDEVVKLKFEGPSSCNMKRTHEILETRTGGLVIWRTGSSVVLYRGMAYKLHCVQSYIKQERDNVNISEYSQDAANVIIQDIGVKDIVKTTESVISDSARYLKDLSEEELMDLSELNHLLDELGPRFKDWSGREPLPVDADLLPSVVHEYKPPFRLLPYGMRHCLRNREMTFIRRLARTMPPHFALGRSRELQGLAMAMVKLWERSAIAKIAIKRGVQNTCNDRMAEELKNLTGGTLVSRNKDYIVFYRGNDFLPPHVMEALKERRKLRDLQQDEEEQARHRASALIDSKARSAKGPLVAGTLAETLAATSRWGSEPSEEDVGKMIRDSALARHASLVRYVGKKLAHAKAKLKKTEKALRKVQEDLEPAELPMDLETLSDEERFLFRKIGLSMKPFLLLGTRGIFDGTVENMHLHWKYRELVKIIVKGKNFAQVKHIAISLEAESGGVLVSVDRTPKGYAIIVYRGKNYQRPHALRPKNLLTKRQALARSIELQRHEALKHHISDLEERIKLLKSLPEEMKTGNGIDDKAFYSRLDGTYSTDEDMEEDEGEEAYLEIYGSEDKGSNIQNKELLLEGGSI
ncbi:unnamed protein product, partial [Vitis vinifera]